MIFTRKVDINISAGGEIKEITALLINSCFCLVYIHIYLSSSFVLACGTAGVPYTLCIYDKGSEGLYRGIVPHTTTRHY